MTIAPFKLEEYLVEHEFKAPYLLCTSDAESFSLSEIIAMADPVDQAAWASLRLGYTEAPGLPALRHQIATDLYSPLAADDVLCFAGAEEGIFCTLYTLCEPGDHVIVLTPCYQSLLEVAKLRGASITTIDLREENEWRIDIDAIKGAIRPNTKCVVMNFPHNPTGQVITPAELESLVKLLETKGIWLFSDEVYRLLGAPKEGWAQPAASLYNRAVSLGVMSKAFGMAGLRIGWIACQDRELLTRVQNFKNYTSICNSGPAEILSLIALKNKTTILDRNNMIVAHNLALLDEFMKEFERLFSWVRPQGGCVGFVHYTGPGSVDDFCKKVLEESGALLMPASIFDSNCHHFRVGFGRATMPEALEQFRGFLKLNKYNR